MKPEQNESKRYLQVIHKANKQLGQVRQLNQEISRHESLIEYLLCLTHSRKRGNLGKTLDKIHDALIKHQAQKEISTEPVAYIKRCPRCLAWKVSKGPEFDECVFDGEVFNLVTTINPYHAVRELFLDGVEFGIRRETEAIWDGRIMAEND